VDTGVTYEKVTSSERDPAFRVPFLTVQEVASIIEKVFFHTTVEDDGVEWAFRMRGDEVPTVPQCGNIDRNPFFSGPFPAFLGFCEEVINDPTTPTKDTTRRVR